MPSSSQKRFTVSEANHTIPSLEKALSRLDDSIRELTARMPAQSEESLRVTLDGGRAVPVDYLEKVEKIVATSRNLEEKGIIVRDIRRGLLDFPAVLGGKEVLLCWLRGEERVGYYHDSQTGFAGRQPLPPDAE